MQQGNIVETLRQLEGMPVSEKFPTTRFRSNSSTLHRPLPNSHPMSLKLSHRTSPAITLSAPLPT